MLHDPTQAWTGRAAPDPVAEAGLTGGRLAGAADLEIWIEWSEGRRSLMRKIKPLGVLEQFTLVSFSSVDDQPDVWRCGFEFAGRGPNRERQTVSLLRRIAEEARWNRVERRDLSGPRSVADGDEMDWDEFGRRLMP